MRLANCADGSGRTWAGAFNTAKQNQNQNFADFRSVRPLARNTTLTEQLYIHRDRLCLMLGRRRRHRMWPRHPKVAEFGRRRHRRWPCLAHKRSVAPCGSPLFLYRFKVSGLGPVADVHFGAPGFLRGPPSGLCLSVLPGQFISLRHPFSPFT